MSIIVISSLTIGLAAFFAVGLDLIHSTPVRRGFDAYSLWWRALAGEVRAGDRLAQVPRLQLVAAAASVLPALLFEKPALLGLGLPFILAPPMLLSRSRASRRRELASQLPSFLNGLADALTTVPNLGQALNSTLEYLEPPMRDEIEQALSETRVGRPLDEALENMARRLAVPGMEPAISAVLLGRRTGGDLPAILRRIAKALREIARLEGVIKTKTAEGRNQAVVMGCMPIVLILALQKIDPNWLAPLWNTPAGWVIVGAVAVLQVTAVALIRRITAVKI